MAPTVASASLTQQHIFLRNVLFTLAFAAAAIAIVAEYLPVLGRPGDYLRTHAWPFWVALGANIIISSVVIIDTDWRRRQPLNGLTLLSIVLFEAVLAACGSAFFFTQIPVATFAVIAAFCLVTAVGLWVMSSTLDDKSFFVEPFTGLFLIIFIGGSALVMWYKAPLSRHTIIWSSIAAGFAISYIVRHLRSLQQGLLAHRSHTGTDEVNFVAVSLLAEPASLFLPSLLWPQLGQRSGHAEPLLEQI